MAWEFDPYSTPTFQTTSRHELTYSDGSTSYIIAFNGSGFNTSGALSAGTITSMQLLISGGSQLVQEITLPSVAASTYSSLLGDISGWKSTVTGWGVTFGDTEPLFTPTLIRVPAVNTGTSLPDGTYLELVGTGFMEDSFLGTVTSVRHVDSSFNLISSHEITGLNDPVSKVLAAFADFFASLAAYDLLTAGANTITNNVTAMDYIIEGGTGSDSLVGGGASTATYEGASGAVIVNLSTGLASGAAGNDTLSGIDFLIGSHFDDSLTGNNDGNFLEGLAGNDTLAGNGGADHLQESYSETGNDSLSGGAGNDTLFAGLGNNTIDGGADTDYINFKFGPDSPFTTGFTLNLGSGAAQNLGQYGILTVSNVENIEGSEFADNITGSNDVNLLRGNGGNDTLNGGGAADNMDGGGGDDVYYVDNGSDIVSENYPGTGYDIIYSSTSSFFLLNAIEELHFLAGATGAISGNGNSVSNVINASAATSSTGAGINGGIGSDTIIGTNAADTLAGEDGGGGSLGASPGIAFGSGSIVKSAGAGNSSLATAMNVGSAFSLASDADIADSTRTPHVSISATGDGTRDFYTFTVNNANAIIHADIDYGFGSAPDDNGPFVGSGVRVYNPSGVVVVNSTGSDLSAGDGGSTKFTDGYLQAFAGTTGVFTVEVYREAGAGPVGIINGNTYELQISVVGEVNTYNDSISGGSGNDTLTGGVGNDTLNGGGDTDRAVFIGNREDYLVRTVNTGGTLTTSVIDQLSGVYGSDQVSAVESLQFGVENFALKGVNLNRTSNIVGSRYDDVVFHHDTTGQTHVKVMTAGSITSAGGVTGTNGSNWDAIDTADMNSDGFADVIYSNTADGSIAIGTMSAAGVTGYTFLTTSLSTTYRQVGASDMDGDGHTDIVVQNMSNGNLFSADFTNLTFNGYRLVSREGTTWEARALGDVNGDGISDVIYQNTVNGDVVAGLLTTSSTVSGYLSIAAVGNWRVKEAADVNADGFEDVVIQNNANGDISYANMAGGVFGGYGTIMNGFGTAWQLEAMADTNNDGDVDAIIRNVLGSGDTYVVNTENGAFQSFTLVAQGIGSEWYVV